MSRDRHNRSSAGSRKALQVKANHARFCLASATCSVSTSRSSYGDRYSLISPRMSGLLWNGDPPDVVALVVDSGCGCGNI